MASEVFNNLLIHPKTQNQLQAFTAVPGHALLIVGAIGSGRHTLAKALSAQLLSTTPERLPSHPYFLAITKPEDKSEISIEAIRQLINKLSLRVASGDSGQKSAINRVALIKDAQNLSPEAQNAVLKLLEEPPAKTLLILTAESEDSLLPTVASRAQKIRVIPVGLAQTLDYFQSYPVPRINSAWLLGQGSAGLISALLAGDSEHPLKMAVDKAKLFLSKDTYGRLIFLQPIAKDRAEFYIFLQALSKVLSALHNSSLEASRGPSSRKLLASRKSVQKTLEQAERNANSRLVALSLALNIRL